MSDRARKEGLNAAFSSTGAGALEAARSVQGDLFEPAMMSPRHRAEGLRSDEERGIGRPKGAKGRRSQEWIDYLGSRYTLPLESLVALGSMSPAELFRELADQARTLVAEMREDEDGKKGGWVLADSDGAINEQAMIDQLTKLLKIQIAAWKEALPYLHEKRGAVVDDGDGNDLPVFAVGVLTRPGASDFSAPAGGKAFDLRPKELREEYQSLSGPEDGKSTDGKSTDPAKSLKDNADEG
tara:strand:- start:5716 stop:6435 length:720 start_codon:yes stop_codon:yes gene_type:complete